MHSRFTASRLILAAPLRFALCALCALCALPSMGTARSQAGAQESPASESWRALPLPTICREPGAEIGSRALWSGHHIVLDPRDDEPAREERRAYRMPVANVIEILEGDAVRRGKTLRFHRPAPPLLARGSKDALENAAAVLDALDTLGRAQAIDLTATLARTFDGKGPAISASRPPADFDAGPDSQRWSRNVRSGDAVVVGTRQRESFLAGFDVQVAAGSEAPDPVFGSFSHGETLHLRAWRVGGGATVFIEGLLDLAHAERGEDFDPRTATLGRIEKPVVHAAQIAFAGEVPSGGALRVALRGAPRADDEWTLWVEARTQSDPVVGWEALDLALIESQPANPALPHPGLGVAPAPAFNSGGGALEALTASALWGEVELSMGARRRGSERARRPLLAYAPGLLVGPTDDGEVWSEARALAAAAAGARTQTAALRVASGAVEAVFPVASGAPARFLVATERLFLTDYQLEIAPESWIAAPLVERALDGVLVQGRLDGDSFPCTWWSTASEALPPLERGDTAHGAVELVRRSQRAGRSTPLVGDAPAQFAPPGSAPNGVPPLRVELVAR